MALTIKAAVVYILGYLVVFDQIQTLLMLLELHSGHCVIFPLVTKAESNSFVRLGHHKKTIGFWLLPTAQEKVVI
jgi:hypothetical protein